MDLESIDHILITCPYTIKVWFVMEILIGQMNVWVGCTLLLYFKNWYHQGALYNYQTLPLLIARGIWLAKNVAIFQNKLIPSF